MPKKVMIDVSGIDWALLSKQKLWLICFEPDTPNELDDEDVLHDAQCADGLVNLLDHIQDEAVKAGVPEAVVFDYAKSKEDQPTPGL